MYVRKMKCYIRVVEFIYNLTHVYLWWIHFDILQN